MKIDMSNLLFLLFQLIKKNRCYRFRVVIPQMVLRELDNQSKIRVREKERISRQDDIQTQLQMKQRNEEITNKLNLKNNVKLKLK